VIRARRCYGSEQASPRNRRPGPTERARTFSPTSQGDTYRTAHLAHVAGPASGLENGLSHGLGPQVVILRGMTEYQPDFAGFFWRFDRLRGEPLRGERLRGEALRGDRLRDARACDDRDDFPSLPTG
jgi:hypothetical protein